MSPSIRRSTRAGTEETDEPLLELCNSVRHPVLHEDDKQLPIAWAACKDDDIHHRVDLKQQAVEDALKNAAVLCGDICSAVKDKKPLMVGAHSRSIFGKEIQSWITEIDKVQDKHRAYEILVGVAGATGAGKSTILNMLLEMPELLPASNSEASTSCACKVSWNSDNDPNHMFIAEVDFRSMDDMKKELEEIFTLMNDDGLNNDDSEAEDYEDLMIEMAETERAIEEGLKKILAVWGLERFSLKEHDPTSLIESDKDFSDRIKPYIDSSPTNAGFKVWPLVKEVRLSVKADILKHGITLVDLPGLSDSVESRAEVAEQFYHKLEVTIIATPARRAIDEKTGVQLMSKYQTLRMQLDGRFGKQKFCVVVSQMDDIDCDVFCKGSREAKVDDALQEDIAGIKSLTKQSAIIEAQLRTEEKMFNKLMVQKEKTKRDLAALKPPNHKTWQSKVDAARSKNRALNSPIAARRKQIQRASAVKREIDAKLAEQNGRVFWTCVRMRHEHIATRITENLRNQQRVLKQQGNTLSSATDDAVEVISVCATAFRDHLKGRKPLGFPTKRYTGIPHLRHWLENAVLAHREAHLDAVLNILRRLLSGIQRCAKVDSGGRVIVFSRSMVENRLSLTHIKYTKKLEDILTNGSERVRKLDPFVDQFKGQKDCRKKSAMVAARWGCKYPDIKSSTVFMHWATFAAILKRKGGPHKTRTPEALEYNFPETLVVPLLESTLPNWDNVFRHEIPHTEIQTMKDVHDIWRKYIDELESEVNTAAASITPHIRSCRPTLLNIEKEIRDRVRETLKQFTDFSSMIHPEFKTSVKSQLEPLFDGCLQIKGINSYRERRKYLQTNVRKFSENMFYRGYNRMKNKHRVALELLPGSFAQIAAEGCDKVSNHIALLLGNLDAMSDQEASFQQRLGASILQWTTDWHAPKLAKRQCSVQTWDMPHDYCHEEGDNENKTGTREDESESGEGDDDEEEDEDVRVDETF
ncbi:hypothetical protein QBC45DRAFT_458486 [Copromyces sp. CBS 386.78]|nr:hypothetical protein QBC45DRAFT_458486 [Copromyces sp. CBS 386.78]